MADNTELTQEDYAGYLRYKAGVEAGKIAADAAKMSVSDVLHRLVGRMEWRHEGERNAAHAAIFEAFPPKGAAKPAETAASRATAENPPTNTDQGYIPARQGYAGPEFA
jgi:hypothetical protein